MYHGNCLFQQMRRYIKCMVLSRFSLDDNVEISSISSKVRVTLFLCVYFHKSQIFTLGSKLRDFVKFRFFLDYCRVLTQFSEYLNSIFKRTLNFKLDLIE